MLVDFFSIREEGLTGSKLYSENYTRMKLLYGLNKVSCMYIHRYVNKTRYLLGSYLCNYLGRLNTHIFYQMY